METMGKVPTSRLSRSILICGSTVNRLSQVLGAFFLHKNPCHLVQHVNPFPPSVVRLEPLNPQEDCSSYLSKHHKPHIYISLPANNTKIHHPKSNLRVTTLQGAGWTHIHQMNPGSSAIGNFRTRIRVWRGSRLRNSTM